MTLLTIAGQTISHNHEATAIGINVGYRETEAPYQISHWQGVLSRRAVVLEPIFHNADNNAFKPLRPIQNFQGSAEGNGNDVISRFSGKSNKVQFLGMGKFYLRYVFSVKILDSDRNGNNFAANKISPQLAAMTEALRVICANKEAGNEH